MSLHNIGCGRQIYKQSNNMTQIYNKMVREYKNTHQQKTHLRGGGVIKKVHIEPTL